MSAAAIFFVDVILIDFDHASSKQLAAEFFGTRLLVISDRSCCSSINRGSKQGLNLVHLLLLLQFLLHSSNPLVSGGPAFELFRIFLTVHQGYSFFELVLESGVFLIFHKVCIDC